jgi:hypothetical protein
MTRLTKLVVVRLLVIILRTVAAVFENGIPCSSPCRI